MAFSPYPITAKNGQQLRVRYLTPEDGDLLVDFVVRLSPQTRYQRFHVSMESASMEEIRRRLPSFLDVDQVDSVALLALHDGPRGSASWQWPAFGGCPARPRRRTPWWCAMTGTARASALR